MQARPPGRSGGPHLLVGRAGRRQRVR